MLYRLEELFPDQIAERLKVKPVLSLSFGTIEWHSDHLPLGLDSLIAQAAGDRIAGALDAVVAPTCHFAVGGVPYPFTLKYPATLIEPLMEATFDQFAAMDFRVIVAYTGHFGLEQTLALKRTAVAAMRKSSVTILPLTAYDLVTDIYTGDHASVGETSMMGAVRPDLVRMNEFPASNPLDGVLGPDPRGIATPEWGEKVLALTVERATSMANRLLNDTSRVDRAHYIEALAAGVRVLNETFERRQRLPKDQVAPVVTPLYIQHCQALIAGDYRAAKKHVEQKLSALEK